MIQNPITPFIVNFDSALYGELFKSDVETFLAQCGSEEVFVARADQSEEIKKIKESQPVGQIRSKMTLRDFHSRCLSDKTHLLELRCYEEMIPQAMRASVQSLLSESDLQGTHPTCLSNYYHRFFYGLKGQYTDPHYDWSAYGGVLIQVFGEKEIILLSPEHATRVPLIYNYLEVSQRDLETFLRQAKLPYAKILLREAEGLFIPPYWIHGVDYLSHTLSLSLRTLPRRSLYRLHKRLPGNKHLVKLLHFFLQQDQEDGFVNLLLNQKNYADFLEVVIAEYQNLFDDYEVISPQEKKHEETIFLKRQSFDYQLAEKLKMEALVRRGAAAFQVL